MDQTRIFISSGSGNKHHTASCFVVSAQLKLQWSLTSHDAAASNYGISFIFCFPRRRSSVSSAREKQHRKPRSSWTGSDTSPHEHEVTSSRSCCHMSAPYNTNTNISKERPNGFHVWQVNATVKWSFTNHYIHWTSSLTLSHTGCICFCFCLLGIYSLLGNM